MNDENLQTNPMVPPNGGRGDEKVGRPIFASCQLRRSWGNGRDDFFITEKNWSLTRRASDGWAVSLPRLRFGLVSSAFNALTILLPHAYDGEFACF